MRSFSASSQRSRMEHSHGRSADIRFIQLHSIESILLESPDPALGVSVFGGACYDSVLV